MWNSSIFYTKNIYETNNYYLKSSFINKLYKYYINRGYFNIIQDSWSCWFPQKGKPCGLCPMCKERIVSHPESTTESK